MFLGPIFRVNLVRFPSYSYMDNFSKNKDVKLKFSTSISKDTFFHRKSFSEKRGRVLKAQN